MKNNFCKRFALELGYQMIIAGDSYCSSKKEGSWVALLNVDAITLSGRGHSNWDILQRLKPYHPQRAIINFTHPLRLPLKVTSGVEEMKSNAVARHIKAEDLNLRVAKQIVETWTEAFIWSPFPHYEHFEGVRYIPLYKENEMYASGEFRVENDRRYPFNHLTLKGNQQLADIINSTYLK